MDIKPIRTQRDYKAALAEIERLFDAKPGTPDGDRLEVLATLVETYEQQHYPMLPPDPVEAIVYFMEARGLSRTDLEPYLGSRAKVSEVLNRKRSLSIEMIRRLHDGLGIPADVLIQPYELEVAWRCPRTDNNRTAHERWPSHFASFPEGVASIERREIVLARHPGASRDPGKALSPLVLSRDAGRGQLRSGPLRLFRWLSLATRSRPSPDRPFALPHPAGATSSRCVRNIQRTPPSASIRSTRGAA